MSQRKIQELDDELVRVLQDIAANKQKQLEQTQDRNKALRVSINVHYYSFSKKPYTLIYTLFFQEEKELLIRKGNIDRAIKQEQLKMIMKCDEEARALERKARDNDRDPPCGGQGGAFKAWFGLRTLQHLENFFNVSHVNNKPANKLLCALNTSCQFRVPYLNILYSE